MLALYVTFPLRNKFYHNLHRISFSEHRKNIEVMTMYKSDYVDTRRENWF